MDFIQSSLNYIFVYGTQYIGNLMYAGFGAIVTWLIEQLTYCSTALFDSQCYTVLNHTSAAYKSLLV